MAGLGEKGFILLKILFGLWITMTHCYLTDDLEIPVDNSLPRIRPLRRQIRDFEPGRTGEITIVYQTTHPDQLRVRWFRKAHNLPYAEMPNHLPTKGDPRYSLHFLGVNDVRAVTLKVADIQSHEFPTSFVLRITTGFPAVEYQLQTNIKDPEAYSIKVLDEIRWVAVTGTPVTFGYHGFVSVTCVAVLDSESTKSTDELIMYRMNFQKATFKKPRNAHGEDSHLDHSEIGDLTSTSIGEIFHPKNNYAEGSTYITIGSRTELPLSYYRYEMTQRINNATLENEGAYACALERYEDKSFVSSWLSEGKPHHKPALELMPCESFTKVKRRKDQDFHYKVTIHQNRETCVRCRAFGFPHPDLVLIHEGNAVTSNEGHVLDEYVNVADGGLKEVSLTFWYPQVSDGGMYECRAYHGKHVEMLKFKVEVRPDN